MDTEQQRMQTAYAAFEQQMAELGEQQAKAIRSFSGRVDAKKIQEVRDRIMKSYDGKRE